MPPGPPFGEEPLVPRPGPKTGKRTGGELRFVKLFLGRALSEIQR